MASRVQVDNVSKVYEGASGDLQIQALVGADFTVNPGEFVSLVGPSGCGKSTLLRAIHGLIEPSEGTVNIDGVPVHGPTKRCGFVFQGAALLPWKTIGQNVLLGARLRDELGSKEGEQRAQEVLKLVGLADFTHKYPHQLSGGMQQRANIARALLVDSSILLMDEPFGALDAMTRQLMQEELLKITQEGEEKKTVIFVTHSLDEAALLSDRIVVMTRRPGRIKAIIDVPFDRPRDASTRHDPAYQDLCDTMWEMIEEEVKDAL